MTSITHISSSWPSFLQFKLSDLSSPHCPDIIFFRRLCLRLKTLEMRLLLERLAHKHGILSGQSMVDCAREMLELTVLLWVQRDRFVESHHDYDWMLMCWGIPSSGVLCVELLKQIKGQGGGLRLPRSEIVQNLSLLIGFLEWVKVCGFQTFFFSFFSFLLLSFLMLSIFHMIYQTLYLTISSPLRETTNFAAECGLLLSGSWIKFSILRLPAATPMLLEGEIARAKMGYRLMLLFTVGWHRMGK